jgi:hypothetical protein
MKIKINDPFGFQKAINFEKLDDPKVMQELSKIFNVDNEQPQTTYKKSVNKLKRGIKKNA